MVELLPEPLNGVRLYVSEGQSRADNCVARAAALFALAVPAIALAQLPNTYQTPGATLKVDAKRVCAADFEASLKPVANWQKEQALERYSDALKSVAQARQMRVHEHETPPAESQEPKPENKPAGSDTPEGYRVQGGRLSLHVL